MTQPNATAQLTQAKEFEFHKRADTPQFFADGVTEAYLGVPTSKLTFHAVNGVSGDGKESRVSVLNLTMPTAALIELCRNILAQSLVARDQLSDGFDLAKMQTQHLLEGLTVPMSTQLTLNELQQKKKK